MSRQDDFAPLLVHVGDDVGSQGSDKLLASAHGYAGSIPGGFEIFGKPGEVRCSNTFLRRRALGIKPRLASLNTAQCAFPTLFQLRGDQ
jgi:hypothetical protein